MLHVWYNYSWPWLNKTPWYVAGLHFECMQCGGRCSWHREGYIWVTKLEIQIIADYLKIKGGKGIATSFGVALGLWPYYTICAPLAFVVWAVVVLIWRYVSLASIAASIAFPLALILVTVLTPGWDFANLWPLLIVATVIPLIVIVRHRENIKRLIAGTESKVFSK